MRCSSRGEPGRGNLTKRKKSYAKGTDQIAVKIQHKDPFLADQGAIESACHRWRLMTRTLVLGLLWCRGAPPLHVTNLEGLRGLIGARFRHTNRLSKTGILGVIEVLDNEGV